MYVDFLEFSILDSSKTLFFEMSTMSWQVRALHDSMSCDSVLLPLIYMFPVWHETFNCVPWEGFGLLLTGNPMPDSGTLYRLLWKTENCSGRLPRVKKPPYHRIWMSWMLYLKEVWSPPDRCTRKADTAHIKRISTCKKFKPLLATKANPCCCPPGARDGKMQKASKGKGSHCSKVFRQHFSAKTSSTVVQAMDVSWLFNVRFGLVTRKPWLPNKGFWRLYKWRENLWSGRYSTS